MFLHTFNIISLISSMRKGNYIINIYAYFLKTIIRFSVAYES